MLAILGVCTLMMAMGLHRIEEGHVGVYFRGGALLPGTTEPGYHWMFPFITNYENVQVTVQTDKVTNIPVCHVPYSGVVRNQRRGHDYV